MYYYMQVNRSYWDLTISYDGKAVSRLSYFFIKNFKSQLEISKHSPVDS